MSVVSVEIVRERESYCIVTSPCLSFSLPLSLFLSLPVSTPRNNKTPFYYFLSSLTEAKQVFSRTTWLPTRLLGFFLTSFPVYPCLRREGEGGFFLLTDVLPYLPVLLFLSLLSPLAFVFSASSHVPSLLAHDTSRSNPALLHVSKTIFFPLLLPLLSWLFLSGVFIRTPRPVTMSVCKTHIHPPTRRHTCEVIHTTRRGFRNASFDVCLLAFSLQVFFSPLSLSSLSLPVCARAMRPKGAPLM